MYGSITASETSGRLDIYVDPVNGSDTSDGGENAPLATLAEIDARLPDFIKHPVVVHLAASGEHEMVNMKRRVYSAPLVLTGDDEFTELVARMAALAATSQIVVKSAGLVVDAYRGKTIEILTGDAAGDRRTIRNNTATDIVPVFAFSATVSAGDEYRIVEPVVTLRIPDPIDDSILIEGSSAKSGLNFSKASEGSLWIVNVKLAADGVTAEITCTDSIIFMGVEFVEATFAWNLLASGSGRFGFGSVGGEELSTPEDHLGAAGERSWVGWGIHVAVATSGILVADGIGVGFIVATRATSYGLIFIQGGNLYSTGFWCSPTANRIPGRAFLDGKALFASDIAVLCERVVSSGTAAIQLGTVTIDAAAEGIKAQLGGEILVTNRVDVTAGTIGIYAETGGVIRFQNGVTVAATGNDTEVLDVEVGVNPTRAIGAYAVKGFIASGDGSVIQRYT